MTTSISNDEAYGKLVAFAKAMASLKKPGFRITEQEEAYETGNFDEAWEAGYDAADFGTAEAARYVLEEIGESA